MAAPIASTNIYARLIRNFLPSPRFAACALSDLRLLWLYYTKFSPPQSTGVYPPQFAIIMDTMIKEDGILRAPRLPNTGHCNPPLSKRCPKQHAKPQAAGREDKAIQATPTRAGRATVLSPPHGTSKTNCQRSSHSLSGRRDNYTTRPPNPEAQNPASARKPLISKAQTAKSFCSQARQR